MFKNMHEILNEGQIGNFKLEKFDVGKNDFSAWKDGVSPGSYIRLINSRDVIMSNIAMEERTNTKFVKNANGDVFIAGLGIGLIVLAIQDKEEVKSITILEKYPEIIELVGNQLPLNEKVKIVQGDVFKYEFPKGTKFDTIYFDIWNYINSDIYEEMKLLKAKYRKYRRSKTINPDFYIGCWAEYQAKNNMRLL